MADKTKYYYLKIKENFFDSEDMKLLESMDNGYLYSNILMKMYLLSLKNNGKLVYKDKIPYNSKMLSTILNHNIDILDKAIKVFKELNLIDILESGAIFMLDIQNYIGKSSDEADRKRVYRNQIENEKLRLLTDKCQTEVGQMSQENKTNVPNNTDKCQTNCSNIKDRDKDITKDKDIVINKDNNIIEYVEQNFGRLLAPIEYETIQNWLSLSFEKDEIIDIIKYAIKIAVMSNKKTFTYVNGILKNWNTCNYKTMQDIKDNDLKNKDTPTEMSEEQKQLFEELEDYNWLEEHDEDLPY